MTGQGIITSEMFYTNRSSVGIQYRAEKIGFNSRQIGVFVIFKWSFVSNTGSRACQLMCETTLCILFGRTTLLKGSILD